MKRCQTCNKVIQTTNGCPHCSRTVEDKTCYVTTVDGIRCDRYAPAFNMCEHHMMLLERLS